MAGYDFEFYDTGTISVTAGQKEFTGTGTAWELRGCEGALVIVAGAGTVNFVSSLSTDAAGEFRTEWTGPDLIDAPYVMWLPSAVAATALANHQRLAEIIASIQTAQPANDILAGLAALQPANNQLIYATGQKTFEMSPLSSLARTLLGGGNEAAMLGTLGLNGDSVSRMLLDTYGIYNSSGVDTNLDALNAGDRGLYTYTAGGVGFPESTGIWFVETQRVYNGTPVRQTATLYAQTIPRMYVRNRFSTGWGQWRLLTSWEGSNTNGWYIRLPDGMQICYNRGFGTGTVWTASGSLYKCADIPWTFPAAFVMSPSSYCLSNANTFIGTANNGTATSCLLSGYLPFSYSSNLSVNSLAIGRWF